MKGFRIDETDFSILEGGCDCCAEFITVQDYYTSDEDGKKENIDDLKKFIKACSEAQDMWKENTIRAEQAKTEAMKKLASLL